MFWDGIFHSFTWATTFTGILLLWRSRRGNDLNLSNYIFSGGLIAGWGIFNLLDSIFNHYLYKFHNVREGVADSSVYNHVFLLIAIFMIFAGRFLIKRGISLDNFDQKH